MNDKAKLAQVKGFVSFKRRELLDIRNDWDINKYPGYIAVVITANQLIKLCEDIEVILEDKKP